MIAFIQSRAAVGLFEGLYLYEIILLVLGVVFFLVLLYVLITYVKARRSIKTLALFFLFPIVMIGYPSIKSVEFGNGIGKTETKSEELEKDPQNMEKQSELKKEIKNLGDRPLSTPQALISLSRAHLLTKDTATAKVYADSAVKLSPNSLIIRNFRDNIIRR
jgi:hypothetical protein